MKEMQQNLVTHLKKYLIFAAIILMTLVLLTPLATQAKTVSKEHKITAATTTTQLKRSPRRIPRRSQSTTLQFERNPRRNPRRDPSRSPRRGQSIPTHSKHTRQ